MAGRIPQAFLDDLLDRTDIVSLIDSRVKLKKTGKNYSACCPFHDEKTPSFTVSQDKQFFYCFGCGATGNAVGFLMDYERLDFPQAVESLAHLAGLEVPREEQSAQQIERAQTRKSLYTLLEKSAEFYREQLKTHANKGRAVNYLKGRGLTGKIAGDYLIGYAPPGWENLLKALGEAEDDKRMLIEGGMLIHQPDQGKLYDRFRERIIFPIRDIRGRVIGFGGRVLDDSKPKYLNSPETPVFHKGKELYGLYEARQAYKEIPRLLVVEGYMDVVSLAQFGICYGVATLGTASGEDHLELAFKYTNEVVFCFDGDEAGRRAARRALEVALPVMTDGRTVQFLFLPDGEDPDTLVRQIGPEKFEKLIASRAIPLEDYLFDAVSTGLDLKRLEHKARLSKLAAPLIYQLPKGVYRELMFQQLAKRTGLDLETLMELAQAPVASEPEPLRPAASAAPTRPAQVAPAQAVADEGYEALWQPDSDDEAPPEYDWAPDDTVPRQPQLFAAHSTKSVGFTPVKLAAALLLYHTELVQIAAEQLAQLEALQDPDLPLLKELVHFLAARPQVSIGQVLGHWRGTHGEQEESRLGQLAGMHLFTSVAANDEQHRELRAQELADIFSELRRRLSSQLDQPLLDKARREGLKGLSEAEREQLRTILAKK
ncbi:DNA primase [Simiduia agarivorans]|uniref:DNA primase n=1 Tax=Simiduia agarivorans (strain DSM 21679 / JCM 13881 / BCRC 17597 / SA1) TaxID=1117647 RepID=K4KJB2_SIMAS|nr:DNA primase [Simiduia agarivorans]AFU99131.1 DNA primase [Simiduia agarivorans SA1 = DSM 21679]